jgi:hypothetical protein
MHTTSTIPRPRARQVAGALVIMLATTAVATWLDRSPSVTLGGAFASSSATAAGTLAMALYLVRWSPYPRWGFLGAAAVLAATALAGPLVVRGPAAWAADVRPLLWMHPWYIMLMGLTPPSPRRGACAPDTPWAGWLLIGTAALLAFIAWGVAALGLSA